MYYLEVIIIMITKIQLVAGVDRENKQFLTIINYLTTTEIKIQMTTFITKMKILTIMKFCVYVIYLM